MSKRELRSKSVQEVATLTKGAVQLAKQRQLESLSEEELLAVQGGAVALKELVKPGQTEGYYPVREFIKELA